MGYQQDPSMPPAALASPITFPDSVAKVEHVQSVRTPVEIDYLATPGKSLSAYLRALKDKRILGDRCPETGQVFVPPRGVSPLSGRRTDEFIEVSDRGYVESFNITRLPIKTRPDLKPPYISAWVVPDGSSIGHITLVAGIEPEEMRIGLRVKAVWKPDDELEESAANILNWVPSGEPDVELGDLRIVGNPETAAT